MESKSKRIISIANRKINEILNMSDDGMQKAVLANLRRGIGRHPGEVPELWYLIMENVDDDLLRDGRFETALFDTLTLFAWHQQGHEPKSEPMHKSGQSIGEAMADLVFADKSGDIEHAKERIIKKFGIITSSDGTDDLYAHVRSMVSLLKSNDIPLDYADLAYAFYVASYRDDIFKTYLNWGRDFYGKINRNNDTEEETDEEQ